MTDYRIRSHPILAIEERDIFTFTWKGQPLKARAGETIATALFANGIRIFGHHPKRRRATGHLLRQRAMRPMHSHGRWIAGQIMHDTG